MKFIRFSSHAQARLHQRNIRWTNVIEAIMSSETRFRDANGYVSLHPVVPDGRRLRIVYQESEDRIDIVTVAIEEEAGVHVSEAHDRGVPR